MEALRLNIAVLGACLALALTPQSALAGKVLPAQDIEWENLQPDVPEPAIEANADPSKMTLRSLSEQWLSNTDPFASQVPTLEHEIPSNEGEVLAEMSRIPEQETAPVVTKFNGKRVRLAGYIVPLDFESTKLREFLLVPYVGACIHVPAPPTNQVVFIKTKDAIEFTGLYDPVFVTGTMSTTTSKTELAEAGYLIKADGVKPYE